MLIDRIRARGRRVEPGTWIVRVGSVVPGAPPTLADVLVSVSTIGGVPSFESAVEPVPGIRTCWAALVAEVRSWLWRRPDAGTRGLLVHVLGTLPACPARDQLIRHVVDTGRHADRWAGRQQAWLRTPLGKGEARGALPGREAWPPVVGRSGVRVVPRGDPVSAVRAAVPR